MAVTVKKQNNIFLVRPMTDRAQTWMNRHLSSDARYIDGAVVVGPSYLRPILDAMRREGIEVWRTWGHLEPALGTRMVQ